MNHSLINPNQVRYNNLEFWDNPLDKRQALRINSPGELNIPLKHKVTSLSLKSRVPIKDELSLCHQVEMTSPNPWERYEVRLGKVSKSKHVDRNMFCVRIDERHISLPPSDFYKESTR